MQKTLDWKLKSLKKSERIVVQVDLDIEQQIFGELQLQH